MPDVIIITTGDELLYGTTVDTNSAFICSQLFGTGLRVKKHVTVSDEIDAITEALTESLENCDIVITTGGLGPTDDDNTVEAICLVLNCQPVVDAKHMEKMRDFFLSMKIPLNESDKKMVSYPDCASVLNNSKGLAPGFVIKRGSKTVISLPGVPSEMEEMYRTELTPYLESLTDLRLRQKLIFKITGIRESEINSLVRDIFVHYNVRWGITPKSGVCDLLVAPASDDFSFAGSIISEIKKVLGRYLIGKGMETPEEELVHFLRCKNLSISTAESCTGGLLAKRITDIPGSSDVFAGSVVAYSNDMKINVLGVNPEIIKQFGAVSEETAREMVQRIGLITHSDVSVSITGIAGPGGGTELKPVGTVCFGFIICGSEFTLTRRFSGTRERIRTFSSLYAINLLRKELRS